MCGQSTACNSQWHFQNRLSAIKMVHRITHNTAADRRWAISHWNTPPVKKTGTTDNTVLYCYWAQTTALRYSGQNVNKFSLTTVHHNVLWSIWYLGPVLFLLYINDMHRSSDQLRFVHFGDDTTVFASDSDINGVHASVNRELVGVDNWLKTNRLSLNVSKT